MEIWKSHPELPPYIFVSNLGRIKRSATTYYTFCFGKCFHRKLPEKILSGTKLNTKGYRRVNAGGKVFFVSRLVAQAFIENTLKKPQVNHKSGIKTDDRAENLEWVTNQENRDHAVKNGLHPVGSMVSKKLHETDIPKIKQACNSGIPQKTVAKEFGVCQQAVSKIMRGDTWKHVKEETCVSRS